MNNRSRYPDRQVSSIVFKTLMGQFQLFRLPARKNELLQAWDAADEYVLDTMATELVLAKNTGFLVCNDAFGALAVALHEYRVQAWSDSWLSHRATSNNYQLNNLDTASLCLLDSISMPDTSPDIVIVRIPKSMTLLEYQLDKIRQIIKPETRIIAVGMVKNMPKKTWQLLEQYLGKTRTSLARKKARLIFVDYDPDIQVSSPDFTTSYQLPNTRFEIFSQANVFSRDRLDIGTRFFLEHLPVREDAREIVDLGCGNGVLGIMAADKMPEARIHFIDESYMAVDSARRNFLQAFDSQRQSVFHVGDGMDHYDLSDADLVLCNPPFHQQHVVGDFIAQRMFKQSKKALQPEGELWVIGNRHLGYHNILKRFFKKVELVASNRKFVLLMAKG